MSRKRRDLDPEEKELWRRVTAGVKARRKARTEEAQIADAKPAAPPVAAAKRVAMPASPKPVKAAQPPANRAGEKRVRRGKLEIDGHLDLHGYGWEGARAALARFVQRAAGRGARVLIVVTGKGRGGEGALKRALPDWLAAADLRPLISGFAPAHRDHGGAGAFYVFLKRGRDED